ncbi:DEAD/DEAH box helicase domain protein [Thermovirga lienii DSM 17291]|uniref:DEAD/DEAH box helicase domain protein n=1 Tax=Thermovirga lienii (strain ATCC BAA-1197 / DSM 17291 / Cas60314) TaxID=580340 RepID=G7V972_THELD|nr:ATP-dependent DNA helicase [Thermovirga lienii]AER66441.1 DEAD/DEAH box helicase domain protein [Thermovirga lienii DSM 17291]
MMIVERECQKDRISELFSEEGPLSRVVSGYKYRKDQVRLAEEFWEAMNSGEVLLAEAPTGTGKTLSLLVPSLLFAQQGGKVVYVTSTRNLQNQMMDHHIPRLMQVFDAGVKCGAIKGKNNYACYRKVMHELKDADSSVSTEIGLWFDRTTYGELDEIASYVPIEWSFKFAISQEDCLGTRCPFRSECFFLKLIKKAQSWDIVVTNYHFFLSHLIGSKGKFVVPVDVLIFDEAHRVAEIARNVSAIKVGFLNIQRPINMLLKEVVPFLYKEGFKEADSLVKSGNNFLKLGKELFVNFEKNLKPGQVLSGALKSELFLKLKGEYDVISGELQRVVNDEKLDGADESFFSLAVLETFEGLRKSYEQLSWCTSFCNYPNWAYWWDGMHLVSAPVYASEVLKENVEALSPHSLIAVSATLALGGDFSYWQQETGITADRTLVVDSPFELEKQMEIWVVETNKKVTDFGYEKTISRIVEHFCDENGGRTLVLLSSLNLLKSVGEYMKSKTKQYNVYVQGDTQLSKLVTSFREDLTSVLIGSVTFREGFDVPGEGLTQVIIDRIPFDHPEDPIMKTLKALSGREYFRSFVLPKAKLTLKQAAGRLIRTEEDKGRLVILDGRVLSRIDWKIYESLPKVPYKKITLA